MKHIRPKNQIPQSKHNHGRNHLTKAFGLFILALLLVQIVISNRLATTGLQISKMDENIKTLTTQNADLREEVASFSALTAISDRASELGFTAPITPHYFAKEPDVALELH